MHINYFMSKRFPRKLTENFSVFCFIEIFCGCWYLRSKMSSKVSRISKISVKKEDKTPKKLEIWPSQVEHYQRIVGILNRYYAYYDTSETGSGKTHVTIAIALTYKLSLCVIAPVSLIPMWKKTAEEYGVNLIAAVSYDGFRGGKASGVFFDNDRSRPNQFVVHDQFLESIDDGVLFVFDEAHRLKNTTTLSAKAAYSIVDAITSSGSRSRIACLSATPGSKKEQSESLLRLMGIVKSESLYTYDHSTRIYTPTGIKEVYEHCRQINRTAADSIYNPFDVNRSTIKDLCYRFYSEIVVAMQSSSMKKPINDIKPDIKNMFCVVRRDHSEELLEIRNNLIRKTGFDMGNGLFKLKRGDVIREMMMIYKHIEYIKLRIFYRLAITKLRYTTNSKVLIYLWYLESIHALADELKEYNPIVLTGNVKGEDRARMVEEFQKPNNDRRLIIANSTVGGVGLSLDDTHGNFPRHLFISPSFKMIDSHQSAGRVHRGTTKSNPTIRFVYSKNFIEEARLLKTLQNQSDVARGLLHDSDGVFLPGDHEEIYESVFSIRTTFLLCCQRIISESKEGAINDDNTNDEYLFWRNFVLNMPRDIIYEVALRLRIPYLEDNSEEYEGYDPVFGTEMDTQM